LEVLEEMLLFASQVELMSPTMPSINMSIVLTSMHANEISWNEIVNKISLQAILVHLSTKATTNI